MGLERCTMLPLRMHICSRIWGASMQGFAEQREVWCVCHAHPPLRAAPSRLTHRDCQLAGATSKLTC